LPWSMTFRITYRAALSPRYRGTAGWVKGLGPLNPSQPLDLKVPVKNKLCSKCGASPARTDLSHALFVVAAVLHLLLHSASSWA
jgi:hypothetical protein